MRSLLLILTIVALSSCATTIVNSFFGGYGEIRKSVSERDYKDAVEKDMYDPDAIRYRKLQLFKPNHDGKQVTVLCGERNGKNLFGGYTGYKSFVTNGTVTYTSSVQDSVFFCLCRNDEIPNGCTEDSFGRRW